MRRSKLLIQRDNERKEEKQKQLDLLHGKLDEMIKALILAISDKPFIDKELGEEVRDLMKGLAEFKCGYKNGKF